LRRALLMAKPGILHMKKYFLFFFACLSPLILRGQYHDANWISGAGYTGVPITPSNWINYQEYPYQLETFEGTMGLYTANTTLSDNKGSFLLYSNGNRVFNSRHEQIENGDSLSWGELADDFYDEGFPIPDGMLGIPKGYQDSVFYLIHSLAQYATGFGANIPKTHYSVVDMRKNNGLGKVVEKNQIIWSGIYLLGLSACRHGNGRDWWVMAYDDTLKTYFRALFAPDGLALIDTQQIGSPLPWSQYPNGGGQNVFTPDGSKYVDFDAWNGIRIFDFDRCSGLLSNPYLIKFDQNWSFGAGAAVSPNSRLLYVSSSSWIVQYDLQATDIEASADTIMIWQGPYPKFANMNLIMDGKIYIMPFSWTHYGHYIRYPNRKGKDCEVVLGGLYFPNENFATMPHFPNYRLGPLEGSTCDTLGVFPPPLAWWRWDKSDTSAQKIVFTDNSSYKPDTWHWDFGDGQISADTSPVHQYTLPGTYHVCMTVCNANGCDTMCRDITIETISVEDPESKEQTMFLYPSPAFREVIVQFPGARPSARFSLVNVLGQTVYTAPLKSEESTLSLEGIAPGIYWAVLTDEGKRMAVSTLCVAQK